MRIAFVGIEKDWEDLDKRDYIKKFVQYHLELPFYYCRDGKNTVDIYSDIDEPTKIYLEDLESGEFSRVYCYVRPHQQWSVEAQYDVVIHWRKWIDDYFCKNAINVINSQDHSYSKEWLSKVDKATSEGKLKGILCFPEWHLRQLTSELNQIDHKPPLLPGVTLGVDTEVYTPGETKNHRELLWASDLGRGLTNGGFLNIATDLFKIDNRFKSNICYPDYVQGTFEIGHPAFEAHKNLDNGPKLWNLFNNSGFLPYTSTFMEPSSRAHRQAMAAGCIVLYPPNRGTPSDLIADNINGFVRPVSEWVDIITSLSEDEEEFNRISKNARDYAVGENWQVQAQRFNELFGTMKNDD